MEKYILESDINVICVQAGSFPEGIEEAHQKLHAIIPFSMNRRYFGISRPVNGVIVYHAAAEEIKDGEAEKLKYPGFQIEKGEYICITIENFMQDIQTISHAFDRLTAHKDIDPKGYFVEWYLNGKDVRCMIKLRSQ